MDFIKNNPFKIIRLAKDKSPIVTLIIGDNPIKKEIKEYYELLNNNKKTIENVAFFKKAESFFGRDWKSKLGLDIHDITGGDEIYYGGSLIDEEILRGMNFEDLGEHVPDVNLDKTNEIETHKTEILMKKLKGADNIEIKAPEMKNTSQYFTSNVFIYPEDRLSEVKEKIYLATGVPSYRQHLFWIDESNMAKTCYKIKTSDGGELYVDARDLLRINQNNDTNTQHIMGIPTDQYMFNNFDNLIIIALDTFKTVEDVLLGRDKIYIIDLADILEPVRDILLTDKIRQNLIYKTVIYKYYPWLTESIFYQYLQNEASLFISYPLLAPKKQVLQHRYTIESQILNTSGAHKQLDISIIMSIANVTTGARINLRNLFDKLKTSRNHTIISAYIMNGAVRYNLVKHFVGTPNITFPNNTRTGLTIAIPVNAEELYSRSIAHQTTTESQMWSKRTYMFFNVQADGMMYILSHWGDDEKVTFDILIDRMMKLCNPVIDLINAEFRYVFMGNVKQLPHISAINVRYPDISVAIFWPRNINASGFKLLRQEWDPFLDANILSIRPTTFGGPQLAATMDMLLHKGATEYDINQIMRSSVLSKLKNYYEYLSDLHVHQIWEKIYSGRLVKMAHRTSDIKFELFNVTQNNYLRFRQYLDVYLSSVSKIKLSAESDRNIKKLRKLQETDPDLYNMRKYGSDKLYTVLCQEPRQPHIWDKKEDAPRGAIEYKNFTTGKMSYYKCDSAHPTMSFITGVHPLGYCLPCCKKKLSVENEKEDTICHKTGKIEESDKYKSELIEPGKSASVLMRHVVSFGKDITHWRIGMPPHQLLQYFETIGYTNIYLLGVNQAFPGVVDGSLNSLAFIANTTAEDLAMKFIKYLKSGIGFESLMSGEIVKYFESLDNLVGTIHKLFIAQEMGAMQFKFWARLFSELFKLVEDIDIILISALYEQSITLEISTISDKIGILIIQDNQITPLVQLSQEDYFREGKVAMRYFDGTKFQFNDIDETADVTNLIEQCEGAGLKDVMVQTTYQRLAYGISGYDGDIMVLLTFQPFIISHARATQRKLDKIGNSSAIADKLAKDMLTNDIQITTDSAGHTYMRDNKYCVYFVNSNQNVANKNTVNYDAIELINALADSSDQSDQHDQLDELLNSSVKKHKKYNQILMELTFDLDMNKNEAVRTRLKSQIDKIDINSTTSVSDFNKEIKDLDNLDIGLINSIIAQNINNKPHINAIIDSRKFKFDKQIYDELSAMPEKDLIAEITNIFNRIFEFVNIDDDILDNLTIPLAIVKKKLKILNSDKMIYIELVSSDLKNPLKKELLKSGALSSYLLLEMFKFTKYPNEIIEIKELKI